LSFRRLIDCYPAHCNTVNLAMRQVDVVEDIRVNGESKPQTGCTASQQAAQCIFAEENT
jgi:hypothetical protein